MDLKVLALVAALTVLTYAPPAQAHQPGGEMLLPLNGEQPSTGLHPRAQVHQHAQLPLPSHCQAEVKQGGVCEPRGPVAEAVHEERYQTDEEK